MKITRQITFPGGFKVKTRILTDGQFTKAGGENGDLAMWSCATKGGTIYLRKSRCAEDRYSDWKHELQHAMTDWFNWFTQQVLQ